MWGCTLSNVTPTPLVYILYLNHHPYLRLSLIFRIVFYTLIKPRHMHEGYSSCSVCLSVTALAAMYLVYKSQVRCCKVPYGISNVRIV